jgi:hypothetical protein
MLYVLGYIVSTLTGSSSVRYKNFESNLQNLYFVTYFYSSYIGLMMTH